ncbi:MAG: hypothetical protein ACLTZT_19645 [Butyricimonas faecalis]
MGQSGGFYNVTILKINIGYFCQRGQAPNESAGISPLFQFYTEDGHLKTDILTVNRTLTPWDITGSLSSGQTELDTVFSFNWSDVCVFPYKTYFRLPGDSILVFTQPDLPFNSTTATLPRIQIRTLADNKAVREYHLFTKPIEGMKNSDFRPDSFLRLFACLKPDSKKVAIAMGAFPQIIILDLVSGEAKGIRLKGKPGFSPDHEMYCYMSVQCDEKYIYALYKEENPMIKLSPCMSSIGMDIWRAKSNWIIRRLLCRWIRSAGCFTPCIQIRKKYTVIG